MIPPLGALRWLCGRRPPALAWIGGLPLPAGWEVVSEGDDAGDQVHLRGPEGEVFDLNPQLAADRAWDLWKDAGGLERGELPLPPGWHCLGRRTASIGGGYVVEGPTRRWDEPARELTEPMLADAVKVAWRAFDQDQMNAHSRAALRVAGVAGVVGLVALLVLLILSCAPSAELASSTRTLRLYALAPIAVGLCLVVHRCAGETRR
jgi:hypothetical protein